MQPAAGHLHAYARADRVDIGPPDALHEQPMFARREILEQRRTLTHVADDDFERAVVVEIADGRPARRLQLLEARSRRGCDVLESSADVPVQQPGLPISDFRAALDFGIYMTVDEKKIFPPVLIHIQKVRAPADILHVGSQTRLQDSILERAAADIVVQVRYIVAEVRL